MIVPDVNMLVYAFRPRAPEHAAARAWLTEILDGHTILVLTSNVTAGFARVVTLPALTDRERITDVLAFITALRASPGTIAVEPGPRYPEIFEELCTLTDATGNQVPDAHLAAVTIESGGELATRDRGFARFPGLRWRDPLA